MGLFLDLDPEQMVVDENLDDPDLEAELAAITGNKSAAGGRTKNKGKSKCDADGYLAAPDRKHLLMPWNNQTIFICKVNPKCVSKLFAQPKTEPTGPSE